MNGNSSINGNGYQECSPPSINNDLTVQNKLPFGDSPSSDSSTNIFSAKIPSKQSNMSTNGKTSPSEEQAEDNFVNVTRR